MGEFHTARHSPRRSLLTSEVTGKGNTTTAIDLATGRRTPFREWFYLRERNIEMWPDSAESSASQGSAATTAVHGPNVQTRISRVVASDRRWSSVARRIAPRNGVYRKKTVPSD